MRKIVLQLPASDVVALDNFEPNHHRYYALLHDSGSVGLLTSKVFGQGPYLFACVSQSFTRGNHMTVGSDTVSRTMKDAIQNALLDPSVKVIEFDSFLEFTKWYVAREEGKRTKF